MEKGDLIYICSPLSAETFEGIKANMLKARWYMNLVSQKWGCRAIAPHAYLPEIINDNIPEERELALEFGLKMLQLCKAVIVCGNTISKGMKGEIVKALSLQIPVYKLNIYKNICGYNVILETFDKTGEEAVNEMQIL